MLDTLQHAPRVAHGAPPSTLQWRDACQELRWGLLATPPSIAPKFLYDAHGCALYEAITTLPEYHLPRVERAILDRHQADMLRLLPQDAELIDIGSGDGLKARRWLDAGIVRRYIGIDIAADWLSECLKHGQQRYPQVRFDGVGTDLTWGFDLPLPREADRPRLFCYPGSSIGNFAPAEALAFLRDVRRHCIGRERSGLLIGVDTKKDKARLDAAYDDPAGVTAAFNRNLLVRANAELGADFDLDAFRHRAVWNAEKSRMEMHLEAVRPTVAHIQGRRFEFAAGETLHTENSRKFTEAAVTDMAEAAGWRVVRFDVSPAPSVALVLMSA